MKPKIERTKDESINKSTNKQTTATESEREREKWIAGTTACKQKKIVWWRLYFMKVISNFLCCCFQYYYFFGISYRLWPPQLCYDHRLREKYTYTVYLVGFSFLMPHSHGRDIAITTTSAIIATIFTSPLPLPPAPHNENIDKPALMRDEWQQTMIFFTRIRVCLCIFCSRVHEQRRL